MERLPHSEAHRRMVETRKLLSEVYLELVDLDADRDLIDRVAAAANGEPLQSIAREDVEHAD